jgi:hypothetical protein
MTNQHSTPRQRRVILFVSASLLASPALADHMGPSGVGAGGGFAVLGPEILDEGHWAAGFRLIYTRPDQRSDEELETLAGEHVHAHNTDYNLNAAIGAAYGITHELTVSVELPYVRRDDLREGAHSHVGGEAVNEVERLGSVAGIGDVSILAKYRLPGEGPVKLALMGGLQVPTGSTHRRSDDGERLETEHQPGTGSWDPILGAALGSSWGPLNFSASGLYQISGKGAQHTRLGDRLQAGIALSHRFGELVPHEHDDAADHEHHHGDELHEAHEAPARPTWDAFVELTGEWEGRQRIAGETERESGGKSLWVSPGARFNAASGWSFGAAIGLPVWQRIRASHPDNDYRLSLSVGRAF